jgi:hypothetical protein
MSLDRPFACGALCYFCAKVYFMLSRHPNQLRSLLGSLEKPQPSGKMHRESRAQDLMN